jgi:hypothetical protein
MKKNAPTQTRIPVPALSTPAPEEEGGGSGENAKTTIQGLPGKKPNWRCGAPAGNQNARKPVSALSALEARLRDIRRRLRKTIREANARSGPD